MQLQPHYCLLPCFYPLSHCRHTRIGTPMKRGISGGQAKRTNVGIALITNPSVLFLDEPTSGLDSWTSKEVWKGECALGATRKCMGEEAGAAPEETGVMPGKVGVVLGGGGWQRIAGVVPGELGVGLAEPGGACSA